MNQAVTFACLWIILAGHSYSQDLQSSLNAESPDKLVSEARTAGDPARGAWLFHQPHLGCAKCHQLSEKDEGWLGPSLTVHRADQPLSDAQIVEAVLQPSKLIRSGYETTVVLTSSGQTHQGRLLRRSDQQLLLGLASGQETAIDMEDVEAIQLSPLSAMPTGLVNLLASRQQFLDLTRYLLEIRDGGVDRARQLQPPPSMLLPGVPDYESHVDHAKLINLNTPEVRRQGATIYQRVCANCHGTVDQVGSLPTSLRFADGRFKNGSDPYAIYQTLTHGFGMMTPQNWMVPKQKYAVIHYIREHYLRQLNRSQWTEITADYLESLPKGDSVGPEPSQVEPWSAMDYGPYLTHTYEVPGPLLNIAYKGTAIRLDGGPGGVSRGSHWMLWDADTLRWAAGWRMTNPQSRFIDWRGIQFNGEHQIHPKVVGEVVFANANHPGWVNPSNGSLQDTERVLGRDQRRYGPLPKSWGQYLGLYRHEDAVIVHYRIGSTLVYEQPGLLVDEHDPRQTIFLRNIHLGPRSRDLTLCVLDLPNAVLPTTRAADTGNAAQQADQSPSALLSDVRCGVTLDSSQYKWLSQDQRLMLTIKAGDQPLNFSLGITQPASQEVAAQGGAKQNPATPNVGTEDRLATTVSANQLDTITGLTLRSTPMLAQFSSLVQRIMAGQPLASAGWGATIESQLVTTEQEADQPFAVDYLNLPESNPWLAQIRLTGVDFHSDGSLVVCSWDGDVWRVATQPNSTLLRWTRIASGLFQPLGVKIVHDSIYVTCRDQIVKLHDLNGDQVIDFYQCFNNDHQVTEHFHEFAMGLQRDADGNFYYAKSARHALPAVVPHHGTLLRVSADGQQTEIVAHGFRAANGVCLNPDGSFLVTDQEGHWNPKNRINWVLPGTQGKPRFYGNMFGYTDITDSSNQAMEAPLCWITNDFDRSPGELLWVESPAWGPLNGSLLNLSYGTGKVFLVLHEKVENINQGGMIELPIPAFPSGIMRGRFHPQDQHLYLCGMFAWAGSAQTPGGLYRIRATGQPVNLPTHLQAYQQGLELSFASPLAVSSVGPANFSIKRWSLIRSKNYGSPHIDETPVEVQDARLSQDGRTIYLAIPALQPTWCMEIQYDLTATDGKTVSGRVHNTIHNLSPRSPTPGQ